MRNRARSTLLLVALSASIAITSSRPNDNNNDQRDNDDIEKFDDRTPDTDPLATNTFWTDEDRDRTDKTTSGDGNGKEGKLHAGPEQREIDDAVEHGLKKMRELYYVKEPELYRMGLFLPKDHPGYFLASFRSASERASQFARYGYVTIEARAQLARTYLADSPGRESPSSPGAVLRSGVLLDECPLQGVPRCPPSFERYRTADGTCNNLQNPWKGASMLPMQRFLPPAYDDGVQSVRRSVGGGRLPSPRRISTTIHRDRNREMPTVTLMFMQWGQFLDHDIVSSVQARTFNRSVPRCCREDGRDFLPPELTHPECLPISVPEDDWFLGRFGIRCMEFVRSAPTSRIDCDLGWREQISQVTAYIDASTVYGSDPDMTDSLRVFGRGQLLYGRARGDQGPLRPPDPPGGELCRLGAVTTDCFQGGDLRVGDQPGLTALHTVWLRYHNRIALKLNNLNPHWSDEKVFQESRRIVGAMVQHITYREFLPILLGQEVTKLFGLDLKGTGYYDGYSARVNPAPANSFGTAAFRFGHSLVQNSFVRTDNRHRAIPNNVSLHEEQENVENIWSFGSVDRLLLGLSNQPSQRRDEFIGDELTNHLFQFSDSPFGMDLAAVNVQRGRDHGIPSYTAWREPCGLVPLKNWTDLKRIASPESVRRFRSLYAHVDDVDLFSGGLAERPVRGGMVGPTFACIIAQQFSNLRKGDRFWYENGHFASSFTPAQLQQIRRVTFAHVLCRATSEIETVQPFLFLSADNFKNGRVSCRDPALDGLDLTPWSERVHEDLRQFGRSALEGEEGEGDGPAETRGTGGKKRRRKVKPTPVRRKPAEASAGTGTIYVNDQGVYRPFRVKLTNVSTVALHSNGNKKNIRRKPTYSVQTNTKPLSVIDGPVPNRRPSYVPQGPHVDGYLVNYTTNTQTHKPNNPYQVNINIQFVPSHQDQTTDDDRHTWTTTRRTRPYDAFVTKRPSYSHYTRPGTEYFDHEGADYRPTRRPTFEYGTRFEDRPFATSNNPYNDRNPTTRPVVIPSYLYLDNKDYYDDKQQNFRPNRRPIYGYKTDDDGNYETDASDDTFDGQYKHDPSNISDFETGDDIKHDDHDDDDKKFIKISSVHGHRLPSTEEMTNPVYISTVQQKEGDLELPGDEKLGGTVDSALVQIDVLPSEVDSNQWKVYNETEGIAPLTSIIDVVDLNANVSCSPELPRPMKLLETNGTA